MRWVLKPLPRREEIKKISQELSLPLEIAEILLKRGFNSAEEIHNFLNPSLKQMHNPYIFPDMKKASRRIVEAVKRGEKIVIYGDYDTDGVTGASLLYLGIEQLGVKSYCVVPHRLSEGYGFKFSKIKSKISSYVNLIITVDCGVRDVGEVEKAREEGVDVIITDHHEPGDTLPPAYAIINPKTCDYPFKELAGCGVAFKLLQAVYKEAGFDEKNLYKLLDLVSIGTIADVCPLIDENRLFAKFGLKQIECSENLGIRKLLEVTSLSGRTIDTFYVSYVLAPRINALGRLDDAIDAVRLFCTKKEERAKAIADRLNKENEKRQKIQEAIMNDFRKKLLYEELASEKIIIADSDKWHPGVIGIVAGKLCEEFYRPVVLCSFEGDVGRASCRSTPDYNIMRALSRFRPLFLSFGGHTRAAGFTIDRKNFNIIKVKLKEYVEKTLSEKDLEPKLYIDLETDFSIFTDKFIEILDKMRPFGEGNEAPLFLTKCVEVISYPERIQGGVKFSVKDRQGVVKRCIAKGLGDAVYLIRRGSVINIVYEVRGNYLILKDFDFLGFS